MTAEDFERLIILVGPTISKMDTKFRKAIPVQDRLAITLRFLATGDSFTLEQSIIPSIISHASFFLTLL
nr:unnamed protein product [Callosobruchus chinensis]